MDPLTRRRSAALLLITLFVSGCGSTVPTPSATTAISPATPAPPAASPSPSAAAVASPSPMLVDPLLGSVVVTVTDRLRVRSAPEVSDTSIKYEPVLPLETELRVIGGPVSASGYVWYEVAPVSYALAHGIAHGWVAMADHDGEPWIALADAPIAGLDVAVSAVARAPADPADAKSVSKGVTAFGLDLYRKMLADPNLELKGKNVVFSPTSIALALGMARAGAKGKTGTQMDAVLRTSGWKELGAGLNALDQALASRDSTYDDDAGVTHQLALKIANRSFAQEGWSVEPSYLDAVAAAFGADLKLVDYASDPEAARKTINAWVSQKTAKRIPELLLPDNVTPDTRLYLVNAIYLKATWALPFLEDGTAPRSFVRLDGSKEDVPTMRLFGGQEVPYVKGTGWKATELRYEGRDHTTPLAMTLIMPDDLKAFESSLSATRLADISSALTTERTRLEQSITHHGEEDCGTYPYSLDLFMPRFKVGTRAQLKEPLKAMGMPLAFAGAADFGGLHSPADGEPIHISDVIHQANIDVDEKGTEAAAATAVGGDTGGCTGPDPAKEIALRLNHPFLFTLRDIKTGAILFLGRVVDPSLAQ
jgi:serpin B